MEKTPKSYLYTCEMCGSRDVEHAMWVALNTNEVLEEFGTWGYYGGSWCCDCEEHAPIVTWTAFEHLNHDEQLAVHAWQMAHNDEKPERFFWIVKFVGKTAFVQKHPRDSKA